MYMPAQILLYTRTAYTVFAYMHMCVRACVCADSRHSHVAAIYDDVSKLWAPWLIR